MRLLLITPLYPPAVGGAATYFADIVPQLETYDQIENIFVLTEKMPEQPNRLIDGKVIILRLLPTRVSKQRPYLYHALTYLQTQFWFATQFNKLIQRNRINIIHYHTRYRGRLFYRIMRQQKKPVIADLRDKMSNPHSLAKASDHLLCCSYGIYNFAIDGGYPSRKINHIPATFDKPSQQSLDDIAKTLHTHNLIDQKYILYAGDMNYNKGVYELIDAFIIWQKQHKNVKLVLVGTNRDGIKFLTATKKSSAIQYLGHVDRENIAPLIIKSELVILPSRSEGLPTIILEALSLNKKVICPPNVVEFSKYLPDYVLSEISVPEIINKLDSVWDDDISPSYPLEIHDPKIVVEQLVTLYGNI